MKPPQRNDVIAVALLTAILTIFFADVLAGAGVLYARDLLPYSYPGKKVLREVVLNGEFPYWNRALSAGQPMAANPAHEVFYPLTWLILLPDYDYAFQLFIVLHVYIAAWAMYALLRSLALSTAASFLGALSFAAGGVMLSYLTLLPFLASAAWMPLVLLFVRRTLRDRTWRDFVLAAVFFAVQLTITEPTTLLQTGLLAGLYAIHHGLRTDGPRTALRNVAVVGAISTAALLLAAVAVLPAVDHALTSVRGRGIPYGVVVQWSTPPARLAELAHPFLFGHQSAGGLRLYWGRSLYGDRSVPFLLNIYPGILVTLLAISGALVRIRGTRLFLVAFATSVLLALGESTPLWQWLYEIGAVRAIRYPEKFLLMGIFALTVFAAKAFETLLAGDVRIRRTLLRLAGMVTAVAVVAGVVSLSRHYPALFAGTWKPGRELFDDMLRVSRMDWLVAVARGALLTGLVWSFARSRRSVWLSLAGIFCVLDLALLLPDLAPRAPAEYLEEPPAVLKDLPEPRDRYRLFAHAGWHRAKETVQPYYAPHRDVDWVRRNAALPLIPNAFGVQTVLEGDYDSTFLLATEEFEKAARELANRTPRWMEIVAGMSNAHVRTAYVDPREELPRIGGDLRKVQPVRALSLPPVDRYAFARRVETALDAEAFVNALASGRYGLETAFVNGPLSFAPAPGIVHRWSETANTARIEVETAGPAFLTMSVTRHKYWTATIDGAAVPLVPTNLAYQGLVIPTPGRHVIEMRYRNPLIAAGAAITAASLLAAVWVVLRERRSGRSRRAAETLSSGPPVGGTIA